MDELADVLVCKDDPNSRVASPCRADLIVPPLKINSLTDSSDQVAITSESVTRNPLEDILSDVTFQRTSISPRFIKYLETDQTTLDLSRCFLGSLKKYNTRWLAKFVAQCPALTSVSLKATNLNSIDFEVLRNLIIALSAIENLTELIVSCNCLANDGYRWSLWCDTVFANHGLLRLNLANNMLYKCYEPEWIKLEYAIAHAKKLKIVNLCYNGLGRLEGRRFKAFLQCLKQLPATCTINLTWNDLGELGNSDWFLLLNFINKFYGRLILDNNVLSARRQAELNNIYHQRSFIGKTGGTLRSLVCQMIWKNPDKFNYDEDNKTINNVKLLDDVNDLLQSQSACRRC